MGLRGRLRRPGVPGPGRGSRLDPDSARYFRRALETLREGLSPEELEPPKGAGPKRKGAELPRKGAGLPGKGAGLPPSFPPLLGQLAEAFEEHLPSLLAPPCASLCLQGALRALGRSQSERCARLCHALIGRLAPPGPAHDQSPALARGLRDPRLGRALEAALGALDPPALRGLFREGLRGHLRGVASHPLANHGLQRLLDHAPEDVVGEVLQELGPSLGEPLARGCPGVLVALAGAARRSPALQPEALRCLLQAFGCWAPPERRRGCVGALGRLRPLAEGEGPEAPLGPVTLQGSLLLQHLLHFQDPGVVLGGLGALSPPALLALACSPPGSHVWDALLSSPHVPPRAPRRLLRRLQGLLLPLACHPNGSRVLDALWAWSPLPARLAMAAELAPQLQALQRDPHGRGVARTLLLELFLRRRSQWEQLQGTPQNAWDPQKPPGGLSGPLEN